MSAETDRTDDADMLMNPETFAPYSEAALADLALLLQALPEPRRADAARDHAVGAVLLEAAGDIETLMRPLTLVWGVATADETAPKRAASSRQAAA